MADWDTAYVNDLPDSAFLTILPGGRKDADGKTVPRDLRYFPVRNAAGQVDLPHLRNALARIPQASSLTAAQRAAAMDRAKALAKGTSVSGGQGEYSGTAGSGRSRQAMPAEVMGTQTRAFVLELRADGDGRTLVGRAVPYGETTAIPGGTERFMVGAFSRQIAAGQIHTVRLFDAHAHRLAGEAPIGKTTALHERADGLHGEWRLNNTTRASDALELVRAGEVTGLSIGFKAVDGGTKRGVDGAYERHAAHLDHVVLTHEPAYAGAAVTSIRSAVHPAAGYRRDLERARGILTRVLADS